ncbi:MAG: pectate lyase [Williamsia sp.]|nr:pectate lyase [Williamsia sp.]
MNKFFCFLCVISAFTGYAQMNKSTLDANVPALAFPGAEGWGKWTSGGRGGKVLVVSSLNDEGPGSLRDAIKAKGARIVVFSISGTIHLASALTITSDVTIAGQTAPGDGICLADYPVNLKGNNIIVRYMRFRMGDKNQNKGMVDGAGSDDAFGGTRNNRVIIDHCSISWSTDEVCSVYAGDSTTLQWNLLAEPLNYSYHFETGDKDFEHHGYGGIWGGRHASFHHNLFAHCNSRTPRFDGNRNIPVTEQADFRNNVIYDWGSNNVYAGEGGNYNVVNNYYKWGPSTGKAVKERVLNPYKKAPNLPYGKFYLNGNWMDGSPAVTANNWLGVVMNEGTAADTALSKVTAPFPAAPVMTQSATDAYSLVLQQVGATLPRRDTLDQRIINDVKNRTGRMIDVQGGYLHGTPYSQTVNAWPTLKTAPVPKDADGDGMPDAWEKEKGLNPADAGDAAGYKLDKQYTNIEFYINSLAAKR